jgi:uncharacterized protein (TIGR02271 family)
MQSDISHVQPGWRALDRSGDKIGDIEQVGSNHFLVTKGLLFVKDLYIPFDSVSTVDPEAESIFLDVDKDEIDDLGWSEPPTMSTDRPADIGSPAGSDAMAGAAMGGSATTQDSARLTLSEERLQAGTVRDTAGEVAVGKRVVEQQADIDVPVTHDEVEITRRRVDRPMSGAEPVFDDGETVRVPVTAEEVQVDKQARVVEEIEISKRPVTEVRRVSDTVRREEAELDQTGNVQVRSGTGATTGGATAADRRDAYARDQVAGSGGMSQGEDDMLPEAGGAVAGGVAGAAVGTAVGGPPGTVVGGAVGAVGGAMAGDAVDSDEEDAEGR